MSPTPSTPVLIIDDDRAVRTAAAQTLQLAGFEVDAVDCAEAALKRLTADWAGVVISDIRMPAMDGHELHRRIQSIDPELPVILITGHGDIATAVRALREGVYDFIEKPYSREALIESTTRAAGKRALVIENRALRAELAAADASGLIGRSPAMVKLRGSIATVAGTNADVLIFGETGSGKEVVARAVHKLGPRRERPFVALNCGALPEHVVESELFGHARGAFTGADQARIGKIEHSSGGTLFLDEIESMPLDLQVKLLRVLQERMVEPLGSNKSISVDLRVVAATKLDLKQLSREGRFRADLYYRLGVVNLVIPALRDRREDVPLLFAHFVAVASMRYQRAAPTPDAQLIKQLIAHDWPGNVRELRNAAERLVLGIDEPPLTSVRGTLTEQVELYEKSLIGATLAAHRGDLTAVLDALGLPRKTFYDKLKKYGLTRSEYE